MRVAVRNGDALAVVAGACDAIVERIERALVKLDTPRGIVREHALGRDQIDRGTLVLLARRQPPPPGLVVLREIAKAIGLLDPCFAKRTRAVGVRLPGRFLERPAHLLDFTDARAHFDGEIDGQIPDVVGRKVSEHADCLD